MTSFTTGLPDGLHLAVGQVVRIPLTGAMGAGNTWSVSVGPEGGAVGGAVVTARIVVTPPAPPPPPPGPPPASSSAAETLEVTAVGPGRAAVQLRLGRSWEPQPLAQHTITVAVALTAAS